MTKIFFDNNVIYISGSVTFYDVTTLLSEYSKIILKCNADIVVSLKHLDNSNTSILLLMINFMKLAFRRKQVIQFLCVPKFLIELGRVYNLNNILYDRKIRGCNVKRKI